MPESLTFPIKNGLGVSNDRFGFKQLLKIEEPAVLLGYEKYKQKQSCRMCHRICSAQLCHIFSQETSTFAAENR